MKYFKQIISHKPHENKFGDCVRTVVACLLDCENVEEVPHFFERGDATPELIEHGWQHFDVFLASKGLVPFTIYFPGEIPREDVLKSMAQSNPNIYYMLAGQSQNAGHIIICKDDKIVHDPSWLEISVVKPAANGFWVVMVFVPIWLKG